MKALTYLIGTEAEIRDLKSRKIAAMQDNHHEKITFLRRAKNDLIARVNRGHNDEYENATDTRDAKLIELDIYLSEGLNQIQTNYEESADNSLLTYEALTPVATIASGILLGLTPVIGPIGLVGIPLMLDGLCRMLRRCFESPLVRSDWDPKAKNYCNKMGIKRKEMVGLIGTARELTQYAYNRVIPARPNIMDNITPSSRNLLAELVENAMFHPLTEIREAAISRLQENYPKIRGGQVADNQIYILTGTKRNPNLEIIGDVPKVYSRYNVNGQFIRFR